MFFLSAHYNQRCSRDRRDPGLAPEQKAITREMVRQKILRCAGDSHLPTEQMLGRIRAGGKVSSLSKETFSQWEGV